MKVLKRKMLNVLLAFVMVFSFAFSGWGGFLKAINVKAENPTLVTFTHINSSWNDNTQTLGNGMHYTILHLNGVQSSGYYTQGDDWTEMMANATINGGASYFNFCPASFIAGPNAASDFIVIYTATAPTLGDEFIVKAGATFKVGGDDTNVYKLTADICLKYNGTAWEIFTPVVEPEPSNNVPVTFTHINSSWNDNTAIMGNGTHYTILHFDGILSSGYLGQGDDWSEMLADSTINGGASYFNFSPASYITGPNKTDAAYCYLILYSATAPTAGDEFIVTAGATFKVGGDDANVYELTNDICLKFNGTAWEIFTPSTEPDVPDVPETVKVNYTSINVTWNNYFYDDTYCTLLQFDGGISGNGGLDGDYSDLLSKMTINGEAVDKETFWFVCPNWVGASGGIIFRFASNPEVGAEMVLPAGATFTIGGSDSTVYEIEVEVILRFNGTAWATPASATYYVVETTENGGVIHTLSTFQNADGSFTYTLPEYTAEGKVLLGYALTEGGVEKMLPAGEYTTMDGSGLIFSALWAGFTTVDGASIRIASAETSGIRWTTTIDDAGFNNVAYWAKGGYSFGTELSADGFAENFDIAANTWKVENSTYTGVLIDINSKYYETVFTARGYVDITYSNGETKRIYAQANDTTRSIKQVAELAIASGDYSGTQLSILQQIAGV